MQNTANSIEVKPLPYGYRALEPTISEKTLRLHHDKHYAGYVATLNRLIEETQSEWKEGLELEDIVVNSTGKIFNNAAQAWNHAFYFDQFSQTPKTTPEGGLAIAINSSFGSLDRLKELILESATGLFGSGWVWLVSDNKGDLQILSMQNAGNPLTESLTPLLTIDVWEHAYYVDYENVRAAHVESIWSIIDWGVIERRFFFQ